jgi:hypothetical protein
MCPSKLWVLVVASVRDPGADLTGDMPIVSDRSTTGGKIDQPSERVQELERRKGCEARPQMAAVHTRRQVDRMRSRQNQRERSSLTWPPRKVDGESVALR